MEDILSQDEVDALLNGMGGDDTAPENDDTQEPASTRKYDFGNEERIIRGRMPALDLVNERFSRYLRSSMFHLLRRSAEVTTNSIQVLKFSEYIHTLFVPTSINLINFHPLRGTGLIVFEPKLVFAILDNYFGGEGRFKARIEGREFTATELSVIGMVRELCFKGLVESWEPVLPIELTHINHEVNPQFANIVSPTEVVVVASFHIELDGGGGAIHITLPYSMLEPIRDLLDAGLQADSGNDDGRWLKAMKEELLVADVNMSAELAQVKMKLGQILKLKPGDIIPIEMPETVVAKVEKIPMFNTTFGEHNDKASLKIIDLIAKPVEVPKVNFELKKRDKS